MAGHQFDRKIRSDEGYGQETKGKGNLAQHQERSVTANPHQGAVVSAGAHHGQDRHDGG